MKDGERILLRHLMKKVNEETDAARARFPTDLTGESLDVCMTVLTEEIGKLARTINKDGLSATMEVKRQWARERHRRIVTCMSILSRIYLREKVHDALPRL